MGRPSDLTGLVSVATERGRIEEDGFRPHLGPGEGHDHLGRPVSAVWAPRSRLHGGARCAKRHAMTDNAAEQVVNAFVAAIEKKDEAAAMVFVSEDVFYDNVPFGSTTGKAPMAEFLAPMFNNKGPVEFEIVRQMAAGNVVMNERIDRFEAKGKKIALPVAGVFEVNDGLITFWRDYFDNDMFMKALKGE